MITTRELARLLVDTALAAALAGCSGTTDEPGPQPTGSAAPNTVGSSAEESPTSVVDATDPRVDEPPADEITLAYTVPAPRTRETGLGMELLGPVFTEDLVLFTDDRDRLHAVDRESGQEQWQVKRRMTRKDGDTPCALTLPTPDAEVVVVNHGAGDLCGDFTVYSLADGSVTKTYDSVSREGRSLGFDLASNSELVTVGGRTYFLDADDSLLRLEADGTTSTVGSPAVLVDADTEGDASRLHVLPGSDVMIVRLQKPDGEVELDEDEDGKLVGFRINDSDLPELVWEQDVRALMSKGSSPGHVFGQFQISREVPGMVADGFRQGGRDRTRYRAIDPETGELGSPGYSFDASTAPQVPTFALSPVNTSIAGPDSALFTSMHDRGELRPRRVNRIDLDSGTVAWSWTPPGAATPTALTTIDVVSLSPDGSLVYVRANVDVDSRLWELDAATGEPLRNWRFSQELPQGLDLTSAPVTLDGGDVFQLIYTTSQASVMAALYR